MRRARSLARLGVLLLVGMLVSALAACGGGESETESETAAPTRAEYIAEADQICSDANDRIATVLTGEIAGLLQQSVAAAQRLARDARPIIEDAFSDLEALPPPEGDEAELEAMYDVANREVEGLIDAGSSSEKAAQILGHSFFPEFSKLAADYGIEDCAAVTGQIVGQ